MRDFDKNFYIRKKIINLKKKNINFKIKIKYLKMK